MSYNWNCNKNIPPRQTFWVIDSKLIQGREPKNRSRSDRKKMQKNVCTLNLNFFSIFLKWAQMWRITRIFWTLSELFENTPHVLNESLNVSNLMVTWSSHDVHMTVIWSPQDGVSTYPDSGIKRSSWFENISSVLNLSIEFIRHT